MNITGMAVTGDGTDAFTVEGPSATDIPPGGTAFSLVTVDPPHAGLFEAAVHFDNNSAVTPYIRLNGLESIDADWDLEPVETACRNVSS